MKSETARRIRWIAIALLIAGLSAYVRRVPWMTVLTTLRTASPGLLVMALCFHLLALAGKAGIWWTFLEPLGGPRYTTVARGTLMGATLNSLFVGSSGEAGRVLLMSRLTGIRSSSIVATVVLERVVDLCGFTTLLACAAFLFPIPPVMRAGAAIAVVVVVAMVLARRALRRPPSAAASRAPAPPSLLQRCTDYTRHVLASTRSIATPRRVAIAAALTEVDWCSELVSYSLVARAAHFPIGVRGTLLALLAVNVGFLVRVTPGNVGVFELVYATVAHALGFPTDIAISVALLLHLVQDVPTAILGLSLGARFFASAPGETRIRPSQPCTPTIVVDPSAPAPARSNSPW